MKKKENWFSIIMTAICFVMILITIFFGTAMICGLFLKVVLDIAL